jgi:hypothetical protein
VNLQAAGAEVLLSVILFLVTFTDWTSLVAWRSELLTTKHEVLDHNNVTNLKHFHFNNHFIVS